MGWKSKAPIAGALGVVVIGGVAMTVPASAATIPTGDTVTTAVQQIVEGEDGQQGRHGPRHHRGMRGQAVAEQLGIEVDVLRDAVKAVIEVRQDAGEERPNVGDMTPAERLDFRADWIADVAAELGISAAELEAAHDAVFDAKLADAVESGKLTQAEADEMAAARDDGTLFDLREDQRIDALGDELEQMLDNGVIDDAQYDALQAELAEEDLQGFRELVREFREANGFEGRDHRGGPRGAGGQGDPTESDAEGISL